MACGGQLKLRRAHKEIVEARTIARSWLDTDAFTIVRATNADTGRTKARVRLHGSPPDELSLAVGDAIHNTRAALDHAVLEASR